MSVQQDKGKVLQSIFSYISSKFQLKSTRFIYNWQKGLKYITNILDKSLDKQLLLNKCKTFLKKCEEKQISIYYPYYFLLSSAQSNKKLSIQALTVEQERIDKGETEYQKIMLHILLKQAYYKQYIEALNKHKEQSKESTQILQKLKEIHLLSILKIDQWQKQISNMVSHSVFFNIYDYPYLLSLCKQECENLQIQKHQRIHELLMNKAYQKEFEEKIINIIKFEKARQLEMILNLPYFVNLKEVDNKKSNTKHTLVSSNLQKTTTEKKKIAVNQISLKQLDIEQLKIIKKFRSLKKLNSNQVKDEKLNQILLTSDSKIKNQLQSLKERIKSTDKSRISAIQLPKMVNKGIRLILEKQVNIKQESSQSIKQRIKQNLSKQKRQSKTYYKNRSGKQQTKQERFSLQRIKKNVQTLSSIKKKKETEIQMKDKSLKNIKLQLLQKIQQKSSKQRKKINSKTKKITHHSIIKELGSINHLKAECQLQQISSIKKLNKSELQIKDNQEKVKKDLLDKQAQLQKQFNLKQSLKFTLNKKIQNIQNLSQKVDKLQEIPVQTQAELVNLLKIQKQKEYESQKQKIKIISHQLQKQIEQQKQRNNILNQKRFEQEQIMRKKHLDQISQLRKQRQQEQNLIRLRLQQQKKKQSQYEKKIRQQKENNQRMQKQLQTWNQKQQQLLRKIQQQQKKRQKQIEQQRLVKFRQAQRQIKIMEEKEQQIISQYQKINQDMITILQNLKMKNISLQKKIH